MADIPSYSIGDLADAAGVSRRTVRFYVQRGLLPPPDGLGRSACYTDQHLARLLAIKGWQEQGVPLEAIRLRLSGRGRDTALRREAPAARTSPARHREVIDAPGTSWFRQPLAAGIELHVGGGRPPLTATQLAALASALTRILENEGERK